MSATGDAKTGRDPVAWPFIAIGIVIVVTLATLPFVGRFFVAALGGGILVAGLLWRVHVRRQR